jgi:hypothetical protein
MVSTKPAFYRQNKKKNDDDGKPAAFMDLSPLAHVNRSFFDP